MYLESMLGKMAKDIPGLVERMEAAASAATEDMVGSPLVETFHFYQCQGSGFGPAGSACFGPPGSISQDSEVWIWNLRFSHRCVEQTEIMLAKKKKILAKN
jgi:hypothetical protein